MSQSVCQAPYWTALTPAPVQFQWLDHDENCEVAIIGGGVAGTMCAQRFAEAGVSTLLIGQNPIGYGGTAGSAGIISYQVEGGLLALSKRIGIDKAVKIFRLLASSVDTIESICTSLPENVGFCRRDALCYSDDEKENEQIKQEYLARKHNEFFVELLESPKARELYSFPVSSGILSAGISAVCNPYLLTHALAGLAVSSGAKIYENTPALEISGDPGDFTIYTGTEKSIKAKYVILATGTSVGRQMPPLSVKRTSFTMVSVPVSDFSGWNNQSTLCEMGGAKLHLRTTDDNRIFISGLDCGMAGKNKYAKGFSAKIFENKKFNDLNHRLITMFPGIRDIRPEFTYATAYLQTEDKLPVIGIQKNTGMAYALCTGENGIAFACVAADMLLEQYKGSVSADLKLFSPDR